MAGDTVILVLARALGQSEARRQINLAKRRGYADLHGLLMSGFLIVEGLLAAAVTYYLMVAMHGR